ncbi:ribosome maturation factor RimP [Longirhabdus pacifica]|uniref:ribosome maturation factor RimP n=1 Tax=Longirhabdus pacifica TaxID=2305227 RepID=UPI0010089D86|nr:ribosome maturation factor RimP [Longirhabdus pacifica]
MARRIETIVEDLITPYLTEHQFELVDIEYVKEGKNYFLRIFIDKDGGVDIDDCGQISEYISEKLDEDDPITEAYFLEVSSPGAERPLKNEKDYLRAVGKHVYIKTYEPITGKKEFEGTLTAYEEETFVVEENKKSYKIPLGKVANARLAILF